MAGGSTARKKKVAGTKYFIGNFQDISNGKKASSGGAIMATKVAQRWRNGGRVILETKKKWREKKKEREALTLPAESPLKGFERIVWSLFI